MVFQYWFGPSRNVELFRRIPSTSIRVRNPVNPRMYGDPCPCDVFCNITEGNSRSASGVVRGSFRRRSAALTMSTTAGTLIGSSGVLVAVTSMGGSSTPDGVVSVGGAGRQAAPSWANAGTSATHEPTGNNQRVNRVWHGIGLPRASPTEPRSQDK
jgi:hypothetical protein